MVTISMPELFLWAMSKPDGTPLRLDELWALHVIGNAVYFTAGIVEEEHGLLAILSSIVRHSRSFFCGGTIRSRSATLS